MLTTKSGDDPLSALLRYIALLWAALLPTLSLAILTTIAIMPLGIAAEWRFIAALAPCNILHYWADRRQFDDNAPILPALLVFVAGLVVDAMTSGPLGYFALLYLLTTALASVLAVPLARAGLGRWARFAAVAGLVSLFAWAIASLYFASTTALSPLLTAFVATVAVEPAIAAALDVATPTRALRASFANRRT